MPGRSSDVSLLTAADRDVDTSEVVYIVLGEDVDARINAPVSMQVTKYFYRIDCWTGKSVPFGNKGANPED